MFFSLVILGSTRKGRQSIKPAKYFLRRLRQQPQVESGLPRRSLRSAQKSRFANRQGKTLSSPLMRRLSGEELEHLFQYLLGLPAALGE